MTENLSYHEQRRLRKNGLAPKLPTKKLKKPIAKKSKKLLEQEQQAKLLGVDGVLDLFFVEMRKKMKGSCLFCNSKSEKDNDETYRRSIAHLLPKAIFKSVAVCEYNWIELCFHFNSCHTNFDNGMITWEFIKDSKEWEIIKEKLLIVLPLVAPEERKHKLYSKLIILIYG